MPSPLFAAGVAVLVAVGGYELVTRVILKKHEEAPPPDAGAGAGAPAPQAGDQAPSAAPGATPGKAPVTGRPGAKLGKPGPAFLAKHPDWAGWVAAGWHPGMKHPTRRGRPRPAPPVGVHVAPNGKPVMTGDVAKDFAALLAFHSYKKSDVPLYKRFQQSAGLNADGLPGPATMNALQSALQGKGLTLPNVTIYPFTGFDGHAGPTQQDWLGQ
jgi:hypothetical protein